MEKREGKGEQRGAFPRSRGCCSVLGLWLCWDAVSPELLRGFAKGDSDQLEEKQRDPKEHLKV